MSMQRENADASRMLFCRRRFNTVERCIDGRCRENAGMKPADGFPREQSDGDILSAPVSMKMKKERNLV